MPMESLPWSIQGQSHPATVARNAIAALLGAPAATFAGGVSSVAAGGGHGVIRTGDFAVTQNSTPNMTVNVAAGRAVVRSHEAASLEAGVYTTYNDGTVNLAISAADGVNARRDLVVLQVRDGNYSGSSNDARLFVVTGTPAGVPVDPTPPASSLVLARVTVAAGATTITNANITDLRTFASAVGGIQRCVSTNRPTGFEGLFIYEMDTDRLLVHNGSTWITLYAAGTYTPTLTGMAIGTGGLAANSATFRVSAGELHVMGSIIFGTTGATFPGAVVTVSLPAGFTIPAVRAATDVGGVTFHNGAATSAGRAWVESSSTIRFVALDDTGYVVQVGLGAAIPHTWVAGNEITYSFSVPVTG